MKAGGESCSPHSTARPTKAVRHYGIAVYLIDWRLPAACARTEHSGITLPAAQRHSREYLCRQEAQPDHSRAVAIKARRYSGAVVGGRAQPALKMKRGVLANISIICALSTSADSDNAVALWVTNIPIRGIKCLSSPPEPCLEEQVAALAATRLSGFPPEYVGWDSPGKRLEQRGYADYPKMVSKHLKRRDKADGGLEK